MSELKRIIRTFARNEFGAVLSIELVVLAVIALLGLAAGAVSMTDGVISEVADIAGSVQDLNQTVNYEGVVAISSTTSGSQFADALDFADSSGDTSNGADNCIAFDGQPTQEVPVDPPNIAINGGLEEGIVPANANVTFFSGPNRAMLFDEDDIIGWNTTATDNQIEIWESGFAGVDSQEGNYHLEINANQDAQLFQEFTVTPGDIVEYSIWHRGRSGVDVAQVLIGPPGMQVFQQTLSTGNTAWMNYTGTYTVPVGVTTLRIGFESVSSAGGNQSFGNFLDSLEVRITN